MPRFVTYLVTLLIVLGAATGAWFVYKRSKDNAVNTASGDQPHPHSGRPVDPATGKPVGKLVVLVVFDQMRGDYLSRWAGQFSQSGFERIKKEGVWFSSVEIPYACTSTAPGHASISTGAPPSVTGIIENEWFDRSAGAAVYCVEPVKDVEMVPPVAQTDAKASRGTGKGFSPERLLAQTVADKLKSTSAEKSKIVSLSLKDRTAVLMGGKLEGEKSNVAVYCFDTRDGKFHTDTYYRDRAHPWIDEFNTAAIVDQWFGKPWDRFRPNLDYQSLTGNTDTAAGEDRGVSQGLAFPHPTDGGLKSIGPKYYEAVETSPYGNELLFELAKKAIEAEKLGKGETADLLCVSFSSNDLIGHRWGPDSWEVLDITLRSDKLIADLLAHLDATLGKDRYSLVITADHGVCPLPEQEKYPTARRVKLSQQTNEIFPPLSEALNITFGPAPGTPMRWFETDTAKEQERVWPWTYLNYRAIESRGQDVEKVRDYVRDWFKGRPFIETAFTRTEIEKGTFEPGSFGAKVKLAYNPGRCGDVIAIPKPGVLITSYNQGTNHGTPQPYDSHVPVLAIGDGIPAAGTRTEKVSSLIVAPILSHALGIEPPANAVEKLPAAIAK
jgi:hypothetical protein